MKTLIIDNYDSFTYNLYQLVAQINGQSPLVYKNDQLTFKDVATLDVDNIIISPGPGHPDNFRDFGLCKELILNSNLPLLGVCLGHQGIISAFGGKVVLAPAPMHGRVSTIHCGEDLLFNEIPKQFKAIRYHSLVATEEIPDCLEITSRTSDNLIMSIRHKHKPIWGVQFHPESIATEYGLQILKNFYQITNDLSVKIKKQRACSKFRQINSVPKSYTHQLFVKKINMSLESREIYQCLYSKDENTIWLDSNKIIDGISQFTIMGSSSSQGSYEVRYNVTLKQVEVIQDGHVTVESMTIFDFLKYQLAKMTVLSPELPFNFNCGFVGYFGYELKSDTMEVTNKFISAFPDARLLFLNQAVVIDHIQQECYLLFLTTLDNESAANQWFKLIENEIQTYISSPVTLINEKHTSTDFTINTDHDDYIDTVKRCLEYIRAGESYEICLTNRIKIKTQNLNALKYYLILRQLNPAPYAAFLTFPDCAIACSSMERFLFINQNKDIETKPIKGTMPRGKTPEEDQEYKSKLLTDEKFFSENLMIVDLLRNDLGSVCEIGSVYAPHLMQVETYETVHQLVSTVRGKLKRDYCAVDAFKACFPGGSMTGAPKRRTVEIIDQLERDARGIYSGAIGYFALNGSADFNIVIRTATISEHDLSIGTGGAIIALSDPVEEYDEILLKAKSLLNAFDFYLKD